MFVSLGAPRPGRLHSISTIVLGALLAALAAQGAFAQSMAGIQLHRGPRTTGPGRRAFAAPTDGAAYYHNGPTLLCSDCHAAHGSETHGFDGGPVSTGGDMDGDWMPSGAPNGYMLKGTNSTMLCLSCHEGQTFAPDVVDVDVNGLTERAAGFFAPAGVKSHRGHNLTTSSLGKPGDSELCTRCHMGGAMATAEVQCIDCHNPHGNASYRNLWWASWPGHEPPILASIKAGTTGFARYEAANVAYPAPSSGDSAWREITNMCIDCHHTFFGPYYTNAASPYHRHPGTNTESGGSFPINKANANTDPANWVSGTAGFTVARLPFAVVGATNFAGATVVAGNNEVFCLTCHKAHGSANPFSLRWDYGTRTATGAAGCQQCHNNVFNE